MELLRVKASSSSFKENERSALGNDHDADFEWHQKLEIQELLPSYDAREEKMAISIVISRGLRTMGS